MGSASERFGPFQCIPTVVRPRCPCDMELCFSIVFKNGKTWSDNSSLNCTISVNAFLYRSILLFRVLVSFRSLFIRLGCYIHLDSVDRAGTTVCQPDFEPIRWYPHELSDLRALCESCIQCREIGSFNFESTCWSSIYYTLRDQGLSFLDAVLVSAR